MLRSRLRRLRLGAAVCACASAVVVSVLTGVAPAQAAVVRDGSSPATAAASCWAIKQDVPSAADGRYWLLTPQLQSPLQAYCDMTTDGGGWVLVGRGREWWTFGGDQTGTTADLAANPSGPAAFATDKLSRATIDALLGDTRVDALPDGIRLRRAKNTAGTSWQEVRMQLRERDRWSWAFGAGHPLTSITFDGARFTGKTTRDAGTSPGGYDRLWTYDSSTNGWTSGFHYGSSVSGSTASGSYLYGGSSHATPFTQVWLRPRLRTEDLTFPSIPDGGTAEITATPLVESRSKVQPWGVTGTGKGGTGERDTEVQDFLQIGNTMYVAGNFTTVRNSSGSTSVAQPYLAAFNATTGEWISSFRPQVDHEVRALAKLPNGSLLIGGDFSTVAGTQRTGMAALNPSTGALDTSFTTVVENRGRSGTFSVRAFEIVGGQLYVGGLFTHVVKGSSAWYQRNAGRITLADGKASTTWNPEFDGSVMDLDVSADGKRFYAAGYMTTSQGTAVGTGVALSTASGAASLGWKPTYSTTGKRYQQAVEETGSKVWLGGSQHSFFSYATSGFALRDTNITRAGGDIQAVAVSGPLVYSSCHCGGWNYSGAVTYDGMQPGDTTIEWDQADVISLVGAWDSASGAYQDDFAPLWSSRSGHGVWALEFGSDGTLWAGGSLTQSLSEKGTQQFSGGFARFAQRPSAAPGAPSGATATLRGTEATVSWKPSSTGAVTYEVLRGDRVVAVTDATTVTIPASSTADRFFVRATDGRGNYSASTPRIAVTESATVLVGEGEWFGYVFDREQEIPADWNAYNTSFTAWQYGKGPLGWGHDSIVTSIDAPTTDQRALAAYFRKSFTIDDVGAFASYTLTTRADDGVAIYLNGEELVRQNLPTGTLTPTTYASSARSTSTALAAPVTVTIPAARLRAGRNVLSAEVHSNYRSAKDLSFGVTIEARK